jgi:hypothetical protein
MGILNIYGQESWHTDARIVGDREGLEALKQVIQDALDTAGKGDGSATTPDEPEPLFASDGEGYQLTVECHNGQWGIDKATGKLDPNSFWNKEESYPQYLMLEIERGKQPEVRDALRDCWHPWLEFKKVKK